MRIRSEQILSSGKVFGWLICLILGLVLPSFSRAESPSVSSSSPNDENNTSYPSQSIPSAARISRHQIDRQHALAAKWQSSQNDRCRGKGGVLRDPSIPTESDGQSSSLNYNSSFPPPPPSPTEAPLRFLNACNGDYEEAQRRYTNTLEWRRKENIDTILREPFPGFLVIKQHYPHYYHGTSYRGEPVYYEFPAKADIKALKRNGISFDQLLRHYNMITEFQWQMLNRDDHMTSIFIVDLDGIQFSEFFGEAMDLIKKASKVSAEHYPERAGLVFIVNVPKWFKLIWKVVLPLVPKATLNKIFVLRGKEEILTSLSQHVPMENIPAEYGGSSPMPLGQSSEEKLLANLMQYNLNIAGLHRESLRDHQELEGGFDQVPMEQLACRFASWVPARSY